MRSQERLQALQQRSIQLDAVDGGNLIAAYISSIDVNVVVHISLRRSTEDKGVSDRTDRRCCNL